jgi:hypothetical protein
MHIAEKQKEKGKKTPTKQTKTHSNNSSTSGDDFLDIEKLLQK